jgi:hypothetical protein
LVLTVAIYKSAFISIAYQKNVGSYV